MNQVSWGASADTYDRAGRLLTRIPWQAVLVAKKDLFERGQRVLDVGCATGHDTNLMRRAGLLAEGWDASLEMVEAACAKCPSTPFFHAVVPESMPRGRRFDRIIANCSLHHADDPAGAVDALREMLNPGGILVVTIPHDVKPANVVLEAAAVAGSPPPESDHRLTELMLKCRDVGNGEGAVGDITISDKALKDIGAARCPDADQEILGKEIDRLFPPGGGTMRFEQNTYIIATIYSEE